MRFWDSSAVVPLVVAEERSDEMRRLFGDDAGMTVWWATELECVSALARRERSGAILPATATAAGRAIGRLAEAWEEVEPVQPIRAEAVRLVRRYPLRAADALQLAAALAASAGDTTATPFVILDDRLREAAEREGFSCLPTG